MNFTCNSCNLQFTDGASQRDHMKGDWHRYNLKRRVAQLPPVDEELFNTKVKSVVEQDTVDSKKQERRKKKEAILEQKRQILEMARKAMIQKESQINDNGELIEPASQDETAEEVQQPVEEEQEHKLTEEELYEAKLKNQEKIPVTSCLFCHPKQNASFDTVDENIKHMFQEHGLYIPEKRYLVNTEGLLTYLGEKIGLGNVCLVCSFQGRNLESVRNHMQIKRHMHIPYESEDEKLEISEFYDFSASYDQEVEGEVNDEDWEDVDDEELDDEELDTRDGAIIQNGYDLILPTGRVLGHRSLQRYYRQNLAPERELTEAQGTVMAAENRHMLTVQDKQKSTQTKLQWRQEIRSNYVADKRSSKYVNHQKHYRDQLLQ